MMNSKKLFICACFVQAMFCFPGYSDFTDQMFSFPQTPRQKVIFCKSHVKEIIDKLEAVEIQQPMECDEIEKIKEGISTVYNECKELIGLVTSGGSNERLLSIQEEIGNAHFYISYGMRGAAGGYALARPAYIAALEHLRKIPNM